MIRFNKVMVCYNVIFGAVGIVDQTEGYACMQFHFTDEIVLEDDLNLENSTYQ